MSVWRALLKRKLTWIALPVIVTILAMALLAPWIAPFDPDQIDLARKLLPPGAGHLLGTDHLGRDILSRLVWGARTSMGSVVVIVSLVILRLAVMYQGRIVEQIDDLDSLDRVSHPACQELFDAVSAPVP